MAYPFTFLSTYSGLDRLRCNIITSVFLSRRYSRFSALALITLFAFLFFIPRDAQRLPAYPTYPIPYNIPPTDDTQPPLYERYTAYEKALPQHDGSLPFPEGSHANFIFFANHAWGGGWGNTMQEMVMNAHLAYSSGRAFVFDNYTWNRDGPEYSDFNGRLIPSRVPLSVLVAGPLAGGPYSDSTTALSHPRFVSRHYYNQVCPHPYLLHSSYFRDAVPPDASALERLNIWVEMLRGIDDRCVEIQKDTDQLFDIWLIGTSRIHDIIPSLVASPIVKDFSWSPLIHYAFQQNQHQFTSTHTQSFSLLSLLSSYFSRESPDSTTNTDVRPHALVPTPPTTQTTSLPVLALHLRRGDFVQHCEVLYQWRAKYNGYNTLPSFPDRFFAENETLRSEMSEDKIRAGYFDKCLMDVDKIRERVVRAVKEWRAERLEIERQRRVSWEDWLRSWWVDEDVEERVNGMLRKVYVMTNGDREWLGELKNALYEDAQRSAARRSPQEERLSAAGKYDYDFVWSWDGISTTRDMELGWEVKYVAQAMDMYVGQRAELFIGNGFSSLTANIVLLRSAAGVELWRTRFW